MPQARERLEIFNLMTICSVGFSMLSQLPGPPFQHSQRGTLRQIGEDNGLSQGPHWEGLSSAGWMESTHSLCRITAGRAESKQKRRLVHSASSLDSACRGSINSHIPTAGCTLRDPVWRDHTSLCRVSSLVFMRSTAHRYWSESFRILAFTLMRLGKTSTLVDAM